MPALPDLAPIPGVNVSDDDLLLIYDSTNATAYKVTRATLFQNVAVTGEAASFSDLDAEAATFTELTAALLKFVSGGGIGDMVTDSQTVAVPTLAAQASGAVNLSVPGVTTNMAVFVAFSDGLAAGLSYHAHASAVDTVTIRFVNGTSGSITGVNKTGKVMAVLLD